jgi:hypothetical protein
MASGSGAGDADEIKILETKVVILGNTGACGRVDAQDQCLLAHESHFCFCTLHGIGIVRLPLFIDSQAWAKPA